jgi:hypothetical protein
VGAGTLERAVTVSQLTIMISIFRLSSIFRCTTVCSLSFCPLSLVGPLIFQRRTSLYGWSTWVSLLVLFGLFAEGIRCLCLGKYHQEDYGGMSGGGSDGDLTMVPRPCNMRLDARLARDVTSDITMDSCEKLFDAKFKLGSDVNSALERLVDLDENAWAKYHNSKSNEVVYVCESGGEVYIWTRDIGTAG